MLGGWYSGADFLYLEHLCFVAYNPGVVKTRLEVRYGGYLSGSAQSN